MGRRRSSNTWLPERVYAGKSAYEYKPIPGKTIRLCHLNSKSETVFKRYEVEKAKVELTHGSFGQLCDEFFSSPSFAKLAIRTQKDYQANSKIVLPVFKQVLVDTIKPLHIRKYMDKRGATSEVRANREHSFMSKVFSWGYERGKVEKNPCLKVSKFSEQSRDRYIEDWEYEAVLEEAKREPLLYAAMEVSYCCAARQGDVWGLTREQLRTEGIFIRQGKTGVKQIKEWNPRLKSAIEIALSQSEIPSLNYVFCKERNFHPAQRTMSNWFRRYKLIAEQKQKIDRPDTNFDFTFHDIKAKSISDYSGSDKKAFSGHKTDAQVRVYDRKLKLSPTLQ